MQSRERTGNRAFPGLKIETWGTPVMWNLQDCACQRERSGWRWELFFI